jgi:hypothetical protein
VIVVAVMPGAEAVSAALDEEALALELELELELGALLELQAARTIATTAVPATRATLARCVLFI